MAEKNTPADKNNKFTEPAKMQDPHKPLNTWKHMIAHVCIWFLVIVIVMVYFTSTGSPQAGLLEVGVSALIFVVLFHLVMKFFPLVSKIITSAIVIGFGITLVIINYHYLKVVKTEASLKQLLVGDLLVHKILKTIKKEPIVLVIKEEIPQRVSEPENEKLSPAGSPEQLKMTIAETVMSDANLEFLRFAPPSPMMKTGAALITGKYKPDSNVGITTEDVSRISYTTKEYKPLLPPCAEIKNTMPSLVQGVIQETPITMKKLCDPVKEGRIPVN